MPIAIAAANQQQHGSHLPVSRVAVVVPPQVRHEISVQTGAAVTTGQHPCSSRRTQVWRENLQPAPSLVPQAAMRVLEPPCIFEARGSCWLERNATLWQPVFLPTRPVGFIGQLLLVVAAARACKGGAHGFGKSNKVFEQFSLVFQQPLLNEVQEHWQAPGMRLKEEQLEVWLCGEGHIDGAVEQLRNRRVGRRSHCWYGEHFVQVTLCMVDIAP